MKTSTMKCLQTGFERLTHSVRTGKPAYLLALPDEVLEQIFDYLKPADLRRLTTLCKRLQPVIESSKLSVTPFSVKGLDALIRFLDDMRGRDDVAFLRLIRKFEVELFFHKTPGGSEVDVWLERIMWIAARINPYHLGVHGSPGDDVITEAFSTGFAGNRITTLVLDWPEPKAMFNLLRSCSETLKSLALTNVPDDSLTPVQTASELCFPHLVDLTLDVRRSWYISHVPDETSILLFLLTRMPGLRRLELPAFVAKLEGRYVHVLTWPITELAFHSRIAAHPFTTGIHNEYQSDFSERMPHLQLLILTTLPVRIVPFLPLYVQRIQWHTRDSLHILELSRWIQNAGAGSDLREIDIGEWPAEDNEYIEYIEKDDLTKFARICERSKIRLIDGPSKS